MTDLGSLSSLKKKTRDEGEKKVIDQWIGYSRGIWKIVETEGPD